MSWQPWPRSRRAGRRSAALLLAAAVILLAGAAREWTAYRKIDSLPLRPDGTAVQTVVLRPASRCDYRVLLRGTVTCRYTGARYDAATVTGPDGSSQPHNALELEPAELLPAPEASRSGVRSFLIPRDHDFRGRRITARLDRERLLANLYLPPDAATAPFEGGLELELWERDRQRQEWRAASLIGLAALLLGGAASLARLARLLPDRWS